MKAVTPILRLARCTIALLVAACGGEGPQVPSTATSTVSTAASATVAAAVGTVPSVKITDAKGRAVKNVLVRWRITAGGGTVKNDSVRTSAAGEATSGGWTLGPLAGTQTLTATADGVPTVTFTAQAVAGPVSRLVRVTPESQTGTVDVALTQPLSVRAEDTFGNPVSGVPVTFSVATGGGTIADQLRSTDAQGIATSGLWRLGTTAGQQIARASTPAITSVAVFTAVAAPGAPADLLKVAGDGQQGLSGTPIAIAPGVRVVDAFGNPIGNVPVTFTPDANSGRVNGGTVQTDPANGIAFVSSWILGETPDQTLTVTSTAVPAKAVRFSANVVVSLFGIGVRYVGSVPSERQRVAIERAVARWRSVVLGNSGTSRVLVGAGACGRDWLPALDTVVTNAVIYARVAPIDGVNGTLGNANACAFHASSGLTVLGTMLFDSEDLDRLETNGLIDAVIAHEMGHSLGVGTRWRTRGLIADTATNDPIFIGTRTLDQFTLIGGATYTGRPVPVENTGSTGTRLVHWRESVFRNELMTGFVNQGANPLSRVTIGSLADLGYLVSYAGADAYTIASSLLSGFPGISSGLEVDLGFDIAPIPPGREVQVTPVVRRP